MVALSEPTTIISELTPFIYLISDETCEQRSLSWKTHVWGPEKVIYQGFWPCDSFSGDRGPSLSTDRSSYSDLGFLLMSSVIVIE